MVAIRLAYISVILLTFSQATDESEFYDHMDQYDYYHENYYDYYENFPKDTCPCSYHESSHVAYCDYMDIEIVPDCIPDTALVLEFEGNWLAYHPKQFDRFKDLRRLVLALNNFDRLGNDSFIGLSELRELDLSNKFGPPSLSMSLFNLIGTGLSWNHITQIRHDAFTGLSNLTFLDLSGNPITLIDSYAFSDLTNLMVLNLSNPWAFQQVHFSGQSFEGLSSLKYLSLENVDLFNITSFPTGIFRPLSSLEELNLRKFCRPHDGEDDKCPNLHKQIGNIPSLQRLYIDAERIAQLGPGFKSLENLKEIEFLAVLDVHIKSLSNKIFENLESSPLSKVAIKTDLTTRGEVMIDEVMPNTFAAFKHLQVLDFSFFSDSESSCFGEMRNLATGLENTMIKHLRISINNLMCNHDANELPDLRGTELETLDLSHSSIVSVSDGSVSAVYGVFFNKLPKSLKYLYLQYNKIDLVNLKYLHNLEQLQVLDMSYQNQQTMTREKGSVRVGDQGMSNTVEYQMEIEDLKALEIDMERTVGIDEEELYWNREECYPLPLTLQSIDISYSGLFYDISNTFCDTNNSLKILILSNPNYYIEPNDIWKSLDALLQLEVLDLNGNGIQSIPSDAFSKLARMKSLSIAHNNLVSASFELHALTNLERLDLSNNNIQYVSDKFARQIERIAGNQPSLNVHLGKNPLICDCDRMTFVKWLRDTKLLYNKPFLSCTYINGSSISLDHIPEIYIQLQRECKDNTQSDGSSSLLIVSCVLGLVILALFIIILALIRRKRQKADTDEGSNEDNIVLT